MRVEETGTVDVRESESSGRTTKPRTRDNAGEYYYQTDNGTTRARFSDDF